MPAQTPLKPLLDIGDVINLVAPHNVLAMFSKGGFSITPAMGRQPTMYEEMQIVQPSRRSVVAFQSTAPVQKTVEPFNVFDELLKIAPHNILASFFSGGQPLPSGAISVPSGVDLKKFSTTYGSSNWWTGNLLIELQSKDAQITIRAPSDKDLVISKLRIKKMTKSKGWYGPLGVLKFDVLPGESDPDFVPDPDSMPTPTTDIIKSGTSKTYTEDYGSNTWYPSVTEKKEQVKRTRVSLIGVIPKVVTPPTVPTAPFDFASYQQAKLTEINTNWMNDAKTRIGTMNNDDLPTANQYMTEIQSAKDNLDIANKAGTLPPGVLFSGGALPFLPMLAGGALLPFPFLMTRGGQIGSAGNQVSTLTTIVSQASALKSQIDDKANNPNTGANSIYNALVHSQQSIQYPPSGLSDDQKKAVVDSHYNYIKNGYPALVSATNDVHDKVTNTSNGLASYDIAAKNSYNSGYDAISGAVSSASTAQAEAQTQAQAAAAAAEAVREKAGEMANIAQLKKVGGQWMTNGARYEANGQLSTALDAYNTAAQNYDDAGDKVNASLARQKASAIKTKMQAQSTAEAAQQQLSQQQSVLDAQATQLERSGDYEGAAKVYDQLYALTGNPTYQVFAANRRKTAAQQAQLKGSQSQASAVSQAAAEYRQKMKRLTGG